MHNVHSFGENGSDQFSVTCLISAHSKQRFLAPIVSFQGRIFADVSSWRTCRKLILMGRQDL